MDKKWTEGTVYPNEMRIKKNVALQFDRRGSESLITVGKNKTFAIEEKKRLKKKWME